MAGPVFIHCILGPKHLVCFYSGSSSFSSRTFCYMISLILFFHPFSYFSFCGTPGIWMFVTSIATLIYLSFRLDFPLLRLFVVHYVEYFFLLLGQSPQRGKSWKVCYYKHSGMGAGLLLISINSFHFHCAHARLVRYPQAIVLVEFL